MKTILTCLVLLIAFSAIAQSETPEKELTDYIVEWSKAAPNKTNRALSYIPQVLSAAEKYSIDHMLIAVIISQESSWDKNAVGQIGEIGLMQVHGRCAVGCELTSVAGQIDCGVRCLSRWVSECNSGHDMERALNGYATGRCYPIAQVTKRRMSAWRKAVIGGKQ